MPAPQIILELIERFERNSEAYKSGNYNETQVRREFIDPFFEALGWDVNNKEGNAEAYKDVIHEDAVKVSGVTKAPDYSFRIGGQRKFFVEAKQPSINIKDAPAPAFQVRRYAWSAKLPLSIVTDFDEFAIYDCRIRPDKSDKADKARVKYYTYQQYAEKWDEIAAVFSKDAILKGSFDKFAESSRAKRGTSEVDNAFLSEIESWREMLARNIALRNTLSVRELNDSVQRIIDRIIFLRIAEDRGIEDYGALRSLCNGSNIYGRLQELFYKADDRYNSGLFHFRHEKDEAEPPDKLTPDLKIDDKPLKDILKTLYYPDSPYEFSVLPADILGQVYEQFLGKVIRLTSDHRAVVEDKPEVKKAGGVFYTPTYIVDYIVKNTVGKLLDGKNPKKAESLRILDPACGSGSFLLGAYQYLLDWHLKWYSENDPEKYAKTKKPVLYQGAGGAWHLTTTERKRILLSNIYGVDIDTQAVEVTKLSLLLKVLEDETDETLNRQRKLFHERALPNLGGNVKCGNSLIGPDFYNGKQMNMLDTEETQRVNVFDWQAEFPEIFKAGGFDAVIGNPPYVRQEMLGTNFKDYVQNKFSSFAGTADLYVYFIEKSHMLLRTDGLFGIICSNKFMRSNYGKGIRNFLAHKSSLLQLIDFGELPVFQNAATFPIIILSKNIIATKQFFTYAAMKRLDFITLDKEVEDIGAELDESALHGENWTLAHADELAVFDKMRKTGIPLGEYVKGNIYRGIITGLNEAFVIDRPTRDRIISEDAKSAELIKPFAIGDYIRKYRIEGKEKFIILIPRGWTNKKTGGLGDKSWIWFKSNYPSIAAHLEPYAEKAEKRWDKGEYWWELRACDYYDAFYNPKIVYPDIAKESRITFDKKGTVVGNTAYFIPVEDHYLLGILNSRLIFTYFKRNAAVLGDADRGGRLRWFTQDVIKLPIRAIDITKPDEKKMHDWMVQLVEQMLALNKQLPEAKTGHEQTLIQRQIDATDKQIDKLVYELYELTPEEIKIVEGQ